MLKNVFKFGIIVLLLICILAVPVFGFYFGGYASPSIFKEDALFTNRQFGGGTSVYLNFIEDQLDNVTDEDYEKAAGILEERFKAMGYTDVETSVDGDLVKVDISQKTYLDTIFAQTASPASWSFVGSNLSDVICDASMVEDATVTANNQGGYGITLKFSEEGAKKFNANTASYAASSSYIYLMIDGQFMASAEVSGSIEDSFTFGSYNQSDASMIATYVKYGELPAEMAIEKTEALAPSVSKGIQTVIWAVCGVLLLALIVLYYVKGKTVGLFAGAATLANIAIFATAIANGNFILNLATLIAMVVCTLFGGVLLLQAVSPFGAAVSAIELKALSKSAVRITWISALIFALSVALLFFTTGTVVYIARLLTVFSVSFFATFFAFVYFGAHTLANKNA